MHINGSVKKKLLMKKLTDRVGHGESTGRLSFATVDAVFYKRYNLFRADDLTIRVTVDIQDKGMQTASSLQEP